MLKNNELTFGGQQNTHAIVSYQCVPIGGGDTITSGPISLPPGQSVLQPVPSGTYNLSVSYDDGHSERLQIPPDQVDAPAESTRNVIFVY
jgi:hypothetical protein